MHGSNTIMAKKILEMNIESSYKKWFCTSFFVYIKLSDIFSVSA